jgi:hypothetical protein
MPRCSKRSSGTAWSDDVCTLTAPVGTAVPAWLSTPYDGGRHQVGLDKIAALEKEAAGRAK